MDVSVSFLKETEGQEVLGAEESLQKLWPTWCGKRTSSLTWVSWPFLLCFSRAGLRVHVDSLRIKESQADNGLVQVVKEAAQDHVERKEHLRRQGQLSLLSWKC